MIELGSADFWTRLTLEPARLAAEVCAIDVANLDRTLQQHPALYAWVAAAHEMALVDEERAKWRLTKARAKALLRLKAEPDPQTHKPKTVDVLRAEADDAVEVAAVMDEYLAAQEKRGALLAMAKALADRRDMLVQISARQRQESRNYA